MTENYLAVDIGSSNGKIVCGNITQDNKLEMRVEGRLPTPKIWLNGHICLNIYSIYNWICNTLEKVGKIGPIESLGVDSWVSDFGIVNAYGDVIGAPVFYRDGRTKGITKIIEEQIDYKELYRLTTQRKIPDSTLAQLLAVKRETPGLLQNGNQIMHLGDLLMFFFTGCVCSEISAASYSQMFSIKKRCWEDKVFDLFDIPKSIQPPVVSAGDMLGRITKKQAMRYGTNQFAVIAPAVHDTSSACTVVPADAKKNWACIATGSWYLVSMERNQVADCDLSCQYNLSNTALSFDKILLKRNVCAMWIIQECKRIWNRMGITCDYSEIAMLAQSEEGFCAFIDPDSECFYNPEDMPEAIIQYLRNTHQKVCSIEDIGQIARIVYESIAYKCRYSLETLEVTTNQKIDAIYVIGGVSRVSFLNEMLASAMNVEVVAGLEEATAVGNLLIQAHGAGRIQGIEEIRQVVRNTFEFKSFFPKDWEKWSRHYDEFLEICGLDRIFE